MQNMSAFSICYAEGLLAGIFNSVSSRNFRICNTKWFISVQGHAVWNEKCSSNIPKMVNKLVRDIDGYGGYIDG